MKRKTSSAKISFKLDPRVSSWDFLTITDTLRMKIFFLLFLLLVHHQILAVSKESFAFTKSSSLEFDKFTPAEWLSFAQWQIIRDLKDEFPHWRLNLITKGHKEKMGKVLACVGDCRIYRDEGHFQARFDSNLIEGDEVMTSPNSYLWMMLFDGSIARLSAKTSLSLKEINLSSKDIFIHARLNIGQIFWLSRDGNAQLVPSDLRITDVLFAILPFMDANDDDLPPLSADSDYYSKMERSILISKGPYDRLNKLLQENRNKLRSYTSHLFLVMPSGTIYGSNVQLGAVSFPGSDSYVKSYSSKLYLSDREIDPPTFYYRGLENSEEFKLDHDLWYKITERGREISELSVDESSHLIFSELMIKRIPRIMLARELLLRDRATFLSDSDFTKANMGLKYRYNLWDDMENSEGTLFKRVEFLKEYTRRVETAQQTVTDRYNEKHKEVFASIFDESYYSKAYDAYFTSKEMLGTSEGTLHSTSRKLWKALYGTK